MLKYTLLLLCCITVYCSKSVNAQKQASMYKGTPYQDALYKKGAQKIPGKLQCEYYDLGGEGIAYHDVDTLNSGSGRLNKVDGSYLHSFRINEPVDISYTKFQDPPIDNSSYNLTTTKPNQLYVGWTMPGEWIKYTIDVQQSGTYQLGILFTSNKNGLISFSVNDIDKTGKLTIPSTFAKADSVAWRQWHHWNYLDNIATIKLQKGIQTFTIHTVDVGNMNYDYINFKKID